MTRFIALTEIFKDGRTRKIKVNVSTITVIKEEITNQTHKSLVYTVPKTDLPIFVTDSFTSIEEKIHGQR